MYSEKVLVGDRLLRQGKFRDALSAYNNALGHLYSEHERNRVKTSIKLCQNYLGEKQKNESYFSVDQSLRDDFPLFLSNKAENKDVVIEDTLLSKNLKINAREIARRACISPFQTALLLLMAKLTEELNLGQSIQRKLDATNNHELLIGDIIGCIIDPLYEKYLEITLAKGINSPKICGKTFSNLQTIYQKFKEIKSLDQLEVFLRKNINTKLINPIISPEKSSDINKTTETTAIYAGSIFLNEKRFLEKCLTNHYDLVSKWCLVEGTCLGYPTSKVSNDGFSKDYSSLILQLFPDPGNKLLYIAHGWTVNEGEDAKSELRNRYLNGALGEVLVVIDIDEFYPQDAFNEAVHKILSGYDGVVVPQVHFWKGMDKFIIGGYYDISHMRFFRIYEGLAYISNHNFPEGPDNIRLDNRTRFKFDRIIDYTSEYPIWKGVYCYHMGFSKDKDDMKDKTDYYINRGEKSTRPDTTKSRAAWFTDDIPENCKVLGFQQEIYGALSK